MNISARVLVTSLLAITVGCASSPYGQIEAVVTVTGGVIVGQTEADGLKKYLGIPYAAAPVGALRWRPTQPVEPWEGTLEAMEYGPQCMQPSPLNPFYATRRDNISEDCLFLNVWTRAKTTRDKLPVMVWVHGGALVEGSGEFYAGDRLSERDVVVVTINYRLGPFGFFAHPELTAENAGSGNQGYHDQIVALQWVQNNISAFGGDPDNVTIFGESAGSHSMSVLQASPMARGLFHKIIGQSGARFLPIPYLQKATAYAPSAESWGIHLGEVLSAGKQLDLAGLRNLSATQIIEAFQHEPDVWRNFDALTIVDGRVLPEQVYDIFSRGMQADVPILVGSNEDEASPFNVDALDEESANRLNYKALTLAAIEAILPEVDERIAAFYPVATMTQAAQSYVAFETDVSFTQPMRVWADMMEKVGSNAYLYWWNWQPSVNGSRRFKAFHAGEIPYVFGMIGEDAVFGFYVDDSPEDREFADLMMTIWTNFARTGNPSVPGVIAWPVYTTEGQEMVVLGPEIYQAERIRAEAVDLISEAFDKRRAR